MKSQAIVEFGKPLQAHEAPTPEPKGSEVLVQIENCGVCHSDVHLHDGYFEMGGGNKLDVRRGRNLPFTLGHEIQGKVVAAGPDASSAKAGTRVVVFPWIGCGKCGTCERGDEHLCNAPRALGVSVPGGYASHVLVPHPRYLLDFGSISPALAATYMCSGLTAFSALKKLGEAGLQDPILIVGLGGVGMMGLQFAKALFPKAPLYAADVDEAKLSQAERAGAKPVNPKEADAAKKLLAATQGMYGAVDFVGSEPSFNFGNASLRKGGKLVVVGLFGGAFSSPIPLLPMRAVSIIGSYVGSLGETKEMLSLVKAGKVAPIPIEERPLAQASKTLDDLRQGKIIGRVVLRP
jgi:D-arabinose 1-dehydrogenase-like Zn-dependent alcohol dehydrogenase